MTMDQLSSILQSPVAILLLLCVAVLWFNAERKKACVRDEARDMETRKREEDCVARVRALEHRHVEYLETAGVEMTRALVRNTEALDNHAEMIARNTEATKHQTETINRHFSYTAK